jgi:hypothetical protein
VKRANTNKTITAMIAPHSPFLPEKTEPRIKDAMAVRAKKTRSKMKILLMIFFAWF